MMMMMMARGKERRDDETAQAEIGKRAFEELKGEGLTSAAGFV